jgi:hypothetical protein
MTNQSAYIVILETMPMAVTTGKRRAKPKKSPKARKAVKRRSAAAASLASPLYRKRVVRSAKLYRRKSRSKGQEEENEEV